ncbi:hypothetical protein [Streptomyces sp. NPDC029674]|uniref:hypothetical protein n=1 Tax=Streptomyces sp. NPDC029674 TaxID=3365297 RepID=UPI00384AEFC8
MTHGGYQGWGPPNGQPQGPDAPNPYPYGPPPPATPYPHPPQRARRRSLGCGLFFVSPLIPVVRSARRRAEAIFNQPGAGRVDDRLVSRVQLWRAALGAAASFLLIYTYGADDGWSGVANDGVTKLILAPLLLILTGPLVVLGFIRYAPAARRPLLRSRLRTPLKAVAWYVGILAGVGVVLAGSTVLLRQDYGTLPDGLLALALLIGLVWLLPFLLFASAYAARYAFNTSNVHAALPAALTVVLVWELTLCSLALEGGMPHGPPAAQWCAVLGGPVTVTAVALWELHRMRTRYGVRVRTGA